MSRTRHKTRKPYGCGPRYWCCDAKRCDQYTHDRWGAEDMRELGDPQEAALREEMDRVYIDDMFERWPEMDRK